MSNQSLRDCTIVYGDEEFYYMDFGPMIRDRTIGSIHADGITSRIKDSAEASPLTFSNEAVISMDTEVNITPTETHTILGGEGIKFKILGARRGETYLVNGKVNLSDGAVKNLEGLLYSQDDQ